MITPAGPSPTGKLKGRRPWGAAPFLTVSRLHALHDMPFSRERKADKGTQ